jgi:hypothetical protein
MSDSDNQPVGEQPAAPRNRGGRPPKKRRVVIQGIVVQAPGPREIQQAPTVLRQGNRMIATGQVSGGVAAGTGFTGRRS